MLYGGVPMCGTFVGTAAAGEEFVYSSGDTNGVFLAVTLGGEAYVDWIDREVNQRLGLDVHGEPDGVPVGSSFAYRSAGWARYGQWCRRMARTGRALSKTGSVLR